MLTKSKRAAIPVIAWIIIAVAGLLLANYAGLFTITLPPETLGKPTELVNPYYYDTAVAGGTGWACDQNTAVKFRTNDVNYGSNSAIAFSETFGNQLTAFGSFSCSGCSGTGYPGTCDGDFSTASRVKITNAPGTLLRWTGGSGNTVSIWKSTADSSIAFVCADYNNHYAYVTYDSDDPSTGGVSTSSSTIDSQSEVQFTPVPIKDVGKYTCENNNVVKKYCNSFPSSDIVQTCEAGQACKFYTSSETINIFGKDAVKCGVENQWYLQSKQLCNQPASGSFFFQTNLDGTSISEIICPSASGGFCIQDTNTVSSKTAHCTECGGTVTRCKPGTDLTVQGCSGGGTWYDKLTCIGDERCQFDSGANSYICKAGNIDGDLRCDPNNDKQRQIWRDVAHGGSNTWQNSGVQCRTKCDITSPDKCTNNCNWAGYNSCSNGILTFCDVNSDTGNIIDMIMNPPRTCVYPVNEPPQCKDTTSCASPYEIGKTYCIGTHLRIGAVDTQDVLVTGGVKLNDLYACQYGCTESNPKGTATCNPSPILPTSKCLRPFQKVCDGLNTIVQCNQYKDYTSFSSNCLSSSHLYCDDSNTAIDAFCKSLPTDCSGSKKCVDSTAIKECLAGYLTSTVLEDCSGNGCTESIAGQPECNPALTCAGANFTGSFYTCEGKFSWPCEKVTANDWDGYKLIKGASALDCSPNECQITSNIAGRCTSQCTSGIPTCQGNDVYSCVGGAPGAKLYSCVPASTGIPGGCSSGSCVHQCSNVGTSCTTVGTEQVSNNCIFNATTSQRVLIQTPCGSPGCNSGTGTCNSECIGNIACNNNRIYNCTAGSLNINELVDNCDGDGNLPNTLGCSVFTLTGNQLVKCNDGCSSVGPLRCSGTSSIVCTKSSTNQLYEKTINCGVLGCNPTTKECYGSIYKNSYDCDPNSVVEGLKRDLYRTNEFGQLTEKLFTCTSPPIDKSGTGLGAYCKSNVSACTYCEKGLYYCVNGVTQFRCSNELTGAAESGTLKTCEAGCEIYPKCDNLTMSLGTTNFPVGTAGEFGDIALTVLTTGSESGKLVSGVAVTGTLSGVGITTATTSGTSDTDGKAYLSYNQIPKGVYSITITAPGYSTILANRKITVTDDFVVSKYGSTDFIYLIPGYTPAITVMCVAPNNAEPDSLVVSGNLTFGVSKKVSTDTRLWEIQILGSPSPGQYVVGFKPVKTGVPLSNIESQELSFQIEKPSLVATTNLPDSFTPGKREFKIQVSGPRYDAGVLTTGSLKPDLLPTATITFNGATNNLPLLDSGGGEYLASYDFTNAGTYVINIAASKSGYNSAVINKPVQVSKSGTETSPATDGSGNASEPGLLGSVTSSYTTWIIAGAAVVIVYLIMRRKR